jgi:hypothetical protein
MLEETRGAVHLPECLPNLLPKIALITPLNRISLSFNVQFAAGTPNILSESLAAG